jgi:hypothetical protein
VKWREGPVPNWHLIGLALLAIGIFWLAEKTAQQVQLPRYRLKLKAAETAKLAQEAIRAELRVRGLTIDLRNDPWETGLIGEERTTITSDRGVSTAKVLATNPNFAAAFVELLHRAGVDKGEKVAVGLTGSMPGWNIAMLAACEAVGAEPVIITSVGASDWGANRPDLTWLDMSCPTSPWPLHWAVVATWAAVCRRKGEISFARPSNVIRSSFSTVRPLKKAFSCAWTPMPSMAASVATPPT